MNNIPIRLKIKSIYNGLTKKEQLIADYILANPNKMAYDSINNISTELNLASSTLFQFAKKLGYDGFKSLKIDILLQEKKFSNDDIHENITTSDNELTIAQKVFESNIKTLNDTKNLLNDDILIKASDLISNAKNVCFFGVGGSEIIANDAYHKFLRTPIKPKHSTDYHIQLMEASMLTENDCAICISHTGKTVETIKLAHIIKKNGAKLIVITSNKSSPLASLADVILISISDEVEFHSEALASRIAQLTILDALYVIIMFKNREKAKKALSKVRKVIYETKE